MKARNGFWLVYTPWPVYTPNLLSGWFCNCISVLRCWTLWRKSSESESHSVDSSLSHGLCSPWNSPGQNTGVGSLSLLQGIPKPGIEPRSPVLQVDSFYQLSHKGRPRILEWEAYPFSRGSSQPWNWTGVSCIAGGFFTNWAMREHFMGFDKHKTCVCSQLSL